MKNFPKLVIMLILIHLTAFSVLGATPDEALQKVIDAARNNDAAEVTVEDLDAIFGISDVRGEFIDDYRDIIANELDPDDEDFVTSLQEFIDAINSTPPDVAVQTYNRSIEDKWPSSRYVVNGDFTVSDTVTQLMWHQCSAGQSIVETVCEDPEEENLSDLVFTWEAALNYAANLNANGGFAGHSDWRVPNIKEVASILARNRYSPAVNLDVFPDILRDFYWSSSPQASQDDQAWQASTLSGEVLGEVRSGDGHILLVRDL